MKSTGGGFYIRIFYFKFIEDIFITLHVKYYKEQEERLLYEQVPTLSPFTQIACENT